MNPYQLDSQGDTRYATLFSPTPSLSLKSVDTGDVEALNRAYPTACCIAAVTKDFFENAWREIDGERDHSADF